MAKILIIIICLYACIYAQQNDSLKVYKLQDIIIVDTQGSVSPENEFYKLNTPAGIDDILSRAAGVRLIRRGNYGAEPSIRGFSDGQIKLTIDGMHIQSACTDKMDPVSIYVEPQNLKSINVNTSPGESNYGAAIGGFINFKLAEPEYSTFFIKGETGIQSVSESYNGNISLNTGNNNTALLINGNYRKSGSYKTGAGSMVPFSYYEKANISLAAQYRISETDEIKANLLFDDGWNIGYPALPMDVGYAKARIYSLSYSKSPVNSSFRGVKIKVYANKISHFMDDTKRPDIFMHMDMPGWSTTYGISAETVLSPAKEHYSGLKAELYHTGVMAEMTMYPGEGKPMFMYTLPETQRLTASLNLSHQWIINSRYALSIFTGIENNTYELLHESGREQMKVLGYHAASSRNILMLNGAIKLTRYYAGNIDLSASIGYTERAPVFNEMFGFYLFNRFDGYDYTGNPGLKPEKSLQSEITLHYIPGYGTVTITVYYNHINNYVSGSIDPALSVMTAGARGVKHFSNLPYADMYGTEASLLLKVNKYIDVFSGIKYSAGKDNNSEPLALIPPLSVLASVKYSPGALSFIAETDYSAKQANVRSTSGERQTPSYILLNSRLSYKMNFTGTPVVISTGVENILNSRYRDHLDWGNILRPGRNFYLSFMLLYNGKNSMN